MSELKKLLKHFKSNFQVLKAISILSARKQLNEHSAVLQEKHDIKVK